MCILGCVYNFIVYVKNSDNNLLYYLYECNILMTEF